MKCYLCAGTAHLCSCWPSAPQARLKVRQLTGELAALMEQYRHHREKLLMEKDATLEKMELWGPSVVENFIMKINSLLEMEKVMSGASGNAITYLFKAEGAMREFIRAQVDKNLVMDWSNFNRMRAAVGDTSWEKKMYELFNKVMDACVDLCRRRNNWRFKYAKMPIIDHTAPLSSLEDPAEISMTSPELEPVSISLWKPNISAGEKLKMMLGKAELQMYKFKSLEWKWDGEWESIPLEMKRTARDFKNSLKDPILDWRVSVDRNLTLEEEGKTRMIRKTMMDEGAAPGPSC